VGRRISATTRSSGAAAARIDYVRRDQDQQRGIIRERFAGMGWEAPRILAVLDGATDLYFDAICRVDVPSWSRGRIARATGCSTGRR
jgi:hypothetical protein